MRRMFVAAGVVVLASCSSAGEAEVSTTPAAPTTVASTAPASTTTVAAEEPTSTTPAPPSTTTTVVEIPEAVCAFFTDYTRADLPYEQAESLRHLSVALGFPRNPALGSALDVLRGRSVERSEQAARAELDDAFGSCPPPGGSAGAGLFEAGVVVGGRTGVALLDGTPVVAPDPTGTYLAAFDDWRGGLFALLEISGLEVIDHRVGAEAVPRDLVLEEDARLHDSARIAGVDVGIVTIWEPAGEFGEPTQRLYLAPWDGSDLVRVATVGDLLVGAETVSYSSGRYLVTEAELGGPSVIYALDAGGERIDAVPGVPIPAGPLDDPAVQALRFARFAPDGASFAYLRNRPSSGSGDLRTDVVVQRLDDDIEFVSTEIGSPGDGHTSLDYDGRFVIVTTPNRLIVFDLRAGPGGELSTWPLVDAEFASFLESGLSLAGDR